jgi:hypothetical protein
MDVVMAGKGKRIEKKGGGRRGGGGGGEEGSGGELSGSFSKSLVAVSNIYN